MHWMMVLKMTLDYNRPSRREFSAIGAAAALGSKLDISEVDGHKEIIINHQPEKFYSALNLYLARNGSSIKGLGIGSLPIFGYRLNGARVVLNYIVAQNSPTSALSIMIHADQSNLEQVTHKLTAEIREIEMGLQRV